MNANARTELNSIKQEVASIINELKDISQGVRRDFVGIGNDKCASCIDLVVNQYQKVYNELNNIN